MNIIPKPINIENAQYNLKLNKGACFYIGVNEKNIHFKDGTNIQKADQVKYLGGIKTPHAIRNA